MKRYRVLEPIFKRRNGRHWPEVKQDIEGICVINVSVSTQEGVDRWVAALAPKLMRLKEDICSELLRLPEP